MEKKNLRDLRREKTTALIKKTSIDVFSRHGFDKATTKMIAQKCKVAESLVIKYFKNKQGLLLSITQDFIDSTKKDKLDYEPQSSLEEELQLYSQSVFNDMLTFGKVHKIIIAKAIVDHEFAKELRRLIQKQEFSAPLNERIERLIKLKLAPANTDSLQIYNSVSHFVFGYYLLGTAINGFSEKDVDTAVKNWTRLYSKGIMSK